MNISETLLKEIFLLNCSVLGEKFEVFLLNRENIILEFYSLEGALKHENVLGKKLEEIENRKEKNIIKEKSEDNLNYKIILYSDVISNQCMLYLEKLFLGIEVFLKYYIEKFNDYESLLLYLDAIDDGISACDEKGVLKYINQYACKIIGCKKEEMINQNLNGYPFKDAVLPLVVKAQKPYMDFEYYLNYKDKKYHIMNSAYPVFDGSGKLKGGIDVFRKITRTYKMVTEMGGHLASFKFENFIGSSKILKSKIEMAKEFSFIDKTILIEGESGTGKDLFAQSIHNHSNRKNGPFVAINCANFSRDLFDSELFGYEEGAFTGAKMGGKVGKFELANEGTIFLDEIGEIPIQLQSKLLRVIETKKINRLGSNKEIYVNVRIIAATNRNLKQMVLDNKFREDLFYRLKVLYIELPSLREREDDVLELCDYFVAKINKEMDTKIIGIDESAKNMIRNYKWNGNIRELENVISVAMFICKEQSIKIEHLKRAGLGEAETRTIESLGIDSFENVNKKTLVDALDKTDYNIRETARCLGISRNTVYRKIKKYKLERQIKL